MVRRSRRQVLKQTGVGVSVGLFSPRWWKVEESSYPPYPHIDEEILNRDGWVEVDQWRAETENSYWSAKEYKWAWLQDLVKEETGGLIDLPLGGLFTIRIGDNGSTYKLGGSTLSNGEKFTFPRFARRNLGDEITDSFQTFLDNFTVTKFNSEGDFDWRYDLLFPLPVDFLTEVCAESGNLDTEIEGEVSLETHYLEYPLREDTVNTGGEVTLPAENTLEFLGWISPVISDGHIYVLCAIHPKSAGDYCGVTDPHIERVLANVTGAEIDLGLDSNLASRVRTVMGAVR